MVCTEVSPQARTQGEGERGALALQKSKWLLKSDFILNIDY